LSLTLLSPPPAAVDDAALERAVLSALAYSDIFEYPLTLEEIHRYLPARASMDEVRRTLSDLPQVGSRQGYFFLKGNQGIVDVRLERARASLPFFRWALRFGRILGSLPFVRMVGMTGSLAVMNLSKGADMDYMLVTQPARLWTARAFAVTFGRLIRLFGHRLCVNILVSGNALRWPIHDLYSARELCQMIPVTGWDVYRRLCAANPWADEILPNSQPDDHQSLQSLQRPLQWLQAILEFPLRGGLGDRLEKWCMEFQVGYMLRRGVSDEVNFTRDVCQANFHSHRKWADNYFRERLARLGLDDTAQERP
jgi:hypothetical protein